MYVAIRIIGSVPRQLVAVIFSLMTACQPDAWTSDYAMPKSWTQPVT
jgi:hypothetical protein